MSALKRSCPIPRRTKQFGALARFFGPAIEAKLVRAAYGTAADMLTGLKILFCGDDAEPKEWCGFRVALYTRMQEF